MKKETQIALAVAVVVLVAVAIALLFVFTGGGGGSDTATQPPMPPNDYEGIGGQPISPAPMGTGAAPTATTPTAPAQPTRVAFTPRRDPFAPLPEELEAMQTEVFQPERYFVLASPPKPPRVELPEPFEPQPRRRVAGIIIGTTVSAILEQEGELPRIVYPGDMVGEFRVAAITETGLVLKRPKGNPREVRVPYEPPGNIGGSGVGAGQGGFGAPGAPGAPAAPGGAGGTGGRGGRGGRA
ncbi:MAG: hypothetical protein ACK4ME_07830, partial [Fimbriimonadales bacterium]